ncbi:MAG: hypothetical protein GKR87_14335 [Kiritimatiellae bacterium]|nr:hypothetical protein [Kiritimatiellia bacterium]
MRTTLAIPEPIYKRAQKMAKERAQPVSRFVAEAIEYYPVKSEAQAKRPAKSYCLKPQSMGRPNVDIDIVMRFIA